MPIFLATLKHKLRRAAQPSLCIYRWKLHEITVQEQQCECVTLQVQKPRGNHRRLTKVHPSDAASALHTCMSLSGARQTRESWSREQIRGFILFGKDGSSPFGWEGDAGRVGSIYLFVVHLLHQEQIAISKSIPRLNLVKIRLRFSQEHINKTLLPPISNCYL
jgi:hypothetical protein